ncbi:MAG: adenylate/guanylate cyclase domain-containing protein [Acidimicrobiales bacterium]
MRSAPETQYAQGRDGLLAYQVVGQGPVDLVFLSGVTSHVDLRWDTPANDHFLRRLASFSRVIAFDRRGTGASDRLASDVLPTWEEWAEDLTVVVDAAGSKSAVIFGVLDGGPMAMVFAATHPDRTTALVLGNTTARYLAAEDYACGVSPEAAEGLVQAVEDGWGSADFAVMASPSLRGDVSGAAWFAKYMRASSSPKAAAAQLRSVFQLDVRDALPSIRVPTLVLHRRSFPLVGVDHGRYLAEHIVDATFVELPGSDSMFFSDGDVVADAIEEFLTGVRPRRDPDRVLATVLFTDLVDSTRRAVAAGDHAWRGVLDQHDAMSRAEVDQHRGRLVKATGDGIVATFDSPGRAIYCALALRHRLKAVGLEMRAGLHTCEVELRGDDIGGIGVHTSARVQACAGSGEVLVSRTVVDLVAGSNIAFEDRGEHELKGVPGTWRLFAVQG